MSERSCLAYDSLPGGGPRHATVERGGGPRHATVPGGGPRPRSTQRRSCSSYPRTPGDGPRCSSYSAQCRPVRGGCRQAAERARAYWAPVPPLAAAVAIAGISSNSFLLRDPVFHRTSTRNCTAPGYTPNRSRCLSLLLAVPCSAPSPVVAPSVEVLAVAARHKDSVPRVCERAAGIWARSAPVRPCWSQLRVQSPALVFDMTRRRAERTCRPGRVRRASRRRA